MPHTQRDIIYKHSNAPAATPVTVDTTLNGTVIAAANLHRQSITLQNVGSVPCLVRLGGNPSSSAYNFILAADSGTRLGQGGSITLTAFQGEIKGITESSSTSIAIYEEISV